MNTDRQILVYDKVLVPLRDVYGTPLFDGDILEYLAESSDVVRCVIRKSNDREAGFETELLEPNLSSRFGLPRPALPGQIVKAGNIFEQEIVK